MQTTTKPCRNCASTEFYTREVSDAHGYLPVGLFSAECRLRVCGGCGLAEWYVKPASLAWVKKKFERES